MSMAGIASARAAGLGLGICLALALGLQSGLAGAATAAPSAAATLVRHGTAHDALYDLAFEGGSGIAVGAFGAVLVSADGGRLWAEQWTSPRREALLGVARRAGHCVIVGQMGAIYSAADCRQWRAAPPVTTARLTAVAMNRDGLAYAVGAFGSVLRSSDWGVSWTPVAIDWSGITDDGAEPHLYSVHVADDGNVTLAGEFELILRSDEGGARWRVLHKGERSLFGLYIGEQGRAYAVGQSGAVLTSSDGGASWRSLASGTSAILTGIAASGGQLVASGINTIIGSRDGGATWQALRSPLVKGAWHQAVAASEDGGKRRLLSVGAGGVVLELNN